MHRSPPAVPVVLPNWVWLSGLMLLLPSPVPAATFQFIGDGASQNLHWMWARYYPVTDCFTSQLYPCGAAFAANGEIPLTGYGPSPDSNNLCLIAKGKLEWSAGAEGPTGQLSAVATTWVRHGRYYPGIQCSDGQEGWVSVDARDVPLEFLAIHQTGDPPTLTLAVSLQLDGSISQQTWIGTSKVTLQHMVSVRVNGVEVTGDTLDTVVSVLSDSTELNWTPQLPDGVANDVVIPNLPWNSQISISLWAYMRGETVGNGRVMPVSSYGEGLALVVHAWAANAVGVVEELTPHELWLSAGPNPTAAPLRIQYLLPEPSPIRISIYDLAGGRVKTVVARHEPAGRGAVTWDGRDDQGSSRSPGLYFVELVAGSRRRTAKVAFLGR